MYGVEEDLIKLEAVHQLSDTWYRVAFLLAV